MRPLSSHAAGRYAAIALFSVPFAVYAGLAIISFSFVADDAYIVARYAANLARGEGLVFNPGERVSALTSPFHAMVLSLCGRASSGGVLTTYKVLMLLVVPGVLGWMAIRLFLDLGRRALFLLFTVASPFVVLWTNGALETPLLLTAIAILVTQMFTGVVSRRDSFVIYACASIAFLIRHDSVLFTMPAVVQTAFRQRRDLAQLVLIGVASVPAVGWLVLARIYYGDFLPTSFYVKTPSFTTIQAFRGSFYFAGFVILTGLAPLALPLWFQKTDGTRPREAHFRDRLWLYLGLAFVTGYGLTAGIKHMMFGYRLFVPFLPAFAVLVLDFARAGVRHRLLLSACILLIAIHGFVGAWVYHRSLNPTLAHALRSAGMQRDRFNYEYADESLKSYAAGFLPTMRRNAEDAKAHWRIQATEAGRIPHISTFAAGVLPFHFPEAYIFDLLTGYRHDCPRDAAAFENWRAASEYIHIIVPRHGSREEQLGPLWNRVSMISSHAIIFDGSWESLEVYFNPSPTPNPQSDRVDRPCRSIAVSGTIR